MNKDSVEAVAALSSEGVAIDLPKPSELPEGARLDWDNATDYEPGLLPGAVETADAEVSAINGLLSDWFKAMREPNG